MIFPPPPPPPPPQRRPVTRRSILRGLVFGVFAACFLGTPLFLAAGHNLRYYGALSSHGVPAQAAVTTTDAQNHNGICYGFTVGTREYQSCGTSDDYDASQLRHGQLIHIVYDTKNPETSCSCQDPSAQFSSERNFAVLLGLIILVFAMFVGIGAERRERDQTVA
jgi:hypothetical protein